MPPWITRTLLASEASSLLSQTHTLLQSIRRSGSPLLLFSLSKHLPSATLSALVTALQSSAPHNLGLLASDTGPFHLSLAAAPPNSLVQPFRSTLRGKPTIALGRELPPNLLKQRQVHPHQQQQDDLAVLHHHDHWHHLWGSTQHIHPLPTELMHLDAHRVSDLIYCSDTAPQALFSTLDHYFPQARQLGLLASSTPFVTGRPFTLIHNDHIHSDGAVGFALSSPSSRSQPRLSLDGWTPVGLPSIVSKAQGNIILELDNGIPPTKVLVDHLEEAKHHILPAHKDSEFYIGMVEPGRAPWLPETANMLGRCISGDPRKGGMAIDCEESFQKGMLVQFYAPSKPSRPPPQPQGPGIFAAARKPEATSLDHVFWAASEHGFVHKSARSPSWLCNVPGASVAYPL